MKVRTQANTFTQFMACPVPAVVLPGVNELSHVELHDANNILKLNPATFGYVEPGDQCLVIVTVIKNFLDNEDEPKGGSTLIIPPAGFQS